MKIFLLMIPFFLVSCMKSKDDYQRAIEDVQYEQAQERQEAEEDITGNPERSRGSNDAEGMGVYE